MAEPSNNNNNKEEEVNGPQNDGGPNPNANNDNKDMTKEKARLEAISMHNIIKETIGNMQKLTEMAMAELLRSTSQPVTGRETMSYVGVVSRILWDESETVVKATKLLTRLHVVSSSAIVGFDVMYGYPVPETAEDHINFVNFGLKQFNNTTTAQGLRQGDGIDNALCNITLLNHAKQTPPFSVLKHKNKNNDSLSTHTPPPSPVHRKGTKTKKKKKGEEER